MPKRVCLPLSSRRADMSRAAARKFLTLILCALLLSSATPLGLAQSEASSATQNAAQDKSQQQADAAVQQVGTPWTGNAGVRETTASIMARQKLQGGRVGFRKHLEHETPTMENLPVNPLSPQVRQSSIEQQQSRRATLAATEPNNPQTTGTSFLGANLADTHAFPPDTMGAVGPAQFIVAVNGRIRSFDKSTGVADGAVNADTDVFFNSVMTPPAASNFTSDPRIRYDRLSGKWFIIIIDVPGQQGILPNRVLLAVSNTSTITPSTVWTYFYFQQDLVQPVGDTGWFADYPTLGIDANALYIGVNIFGGLNNATFEGTTGFVVRKSSIVGAGPIVVSAFRQMGTASAGIYTPQGVDNFNPAATEGYFIGSDAGVLGKLHLRRIGTPGGTPTLSADVSITTAANSSPIRVAHSGNTGGTAGRLDGLDHRLMAAMIRNGHIWTTQNTGTTNTGNDAGTATRNGVRWYDISNVATGQTPTIAQFGTVFSSVGTTTATSTSIWMGTVTVSGQGHAAIGSSRSGGSEFINAATFGRLSSDALNTMQTSINYTSSSTAYNPTSDTGGTGGRRWGDYSYTSVDPSDDMTMWTIQEYCDSANSYGARVVKLNAPPPATPATASPSTIATGQSSVNVTITGTQVNGSGFFDPGANPPAGPAFNHLGATVSGGVVVNSVTYTDPTHLTLNLNTTNVTAGAKNVTITNPDGQSLTANALLTVSNTAPTVSLTSPANSSSFVAPADVPLTANAADTDGSVDHVDFYAGTTLISTDTSAPYNATWTAKTPGTFSLTAVATDNLGAMTTSDAVTVDVKQTQFANIVGHVTDGTNGGAALYNVAVRLNSSQSATPVYTHTGIDGSYSFNNLEQGFNYTITPLLEGSGFTPSGSTVNSLSGNQTLDFVALSNNPPSCSYSLDINSQNFPFAGGTGNIALTAPVGCTWKIRNFNNWFKVGDTDGDGPALISYSVSPNPNATARNGTFNIAGLIFTITQDAAPPSCSYSVAPTAESFGSQGGTSTLNVTTTSGCSWTAASNDSWISINPGSNGGTGNGTVSYSVSVNTGPFRTGTLTVAGQTVTIDQKGDAGGTTQPRTVVRRVKM